LVFDGKKWHLKYLCKKKRNSMSESKDKAVRAIGVSIAGNVVLAVTKGIAGYFGNSYALIADAIESATDVFSSILVLFGLKYSTRPADENHPYGHGRAETLVTFAVVGFLVVSATIIAYESIENIQTPHETPKNFTLYVLAGIILIKEIFYQVLSRKSVETNSSSLKADAWHHRSDAISSGLAFIGISIAIFMGPGYEAADDYAALLASAIIIYNAYLIFRPALGEILDEHLYDEQVAQIRTIAATVPGVIDTEKCFMRKSGMTFLVDLHLIVDGNISVTEGHDIAHRLKDKVMQEIPEIADVLIHVEPDN
jgi:cation diffusion facilitator family transporter